MLDIRNAAPLPEDLRPHLIVVVDTEAEFDWAAEPDSNARRVNAVENLYLAQDLFEEFGIEPCYVVDYPMATQEKSRDVLKDIFTRFRCEVGAHLHPWVNPPIEENLTRENMYPGNLGFDLELAKLQTLTQTIESAFGTRPVIYKAGRYGIGPHTANILKSLGYQIDLSVCPAFDYRSDGGPDFTAATAVPGWLDQNRSILEIPLSGAFVGYAGRAARALHRFAGHFEALRLRGILARLGAVDRLLLSPEGHSSAEHRKLVRFLLDKGVRSFTWSFHSPSLLPGMTMYTRSQNDLGRFLDSFRRFFDFFLGEINGIVTTPTRLKSIVDTHDRQRRQDTSHPSR